MSQVPVQAPRHDLSGRVALVTGASSGLGFEFGHWLADAGARVVFCARSLDKVRDAAEAANARGGAAMAVQMDVRNEASIIAAFDAAEAQFGTVDTVICNAGVGHGGRSTDASAEHLRETMETNLLGVYLTAREAARRMIAAGFRDSERGRIVFIGSITAEQHHTGDAMYAATKAAIAHLSRNFAREWVRQGINVNTLQPGWMATAINADWVASDAARDEIAGLNRRRMVPIESLRDPLLFFCSDASRHVTGTLLTVDDGILL